MSNCTTPSFILLAAISILHIMGCYKYHLDRKADHSPPSSVEVKNDGRCTAPPTYALDGLRRVNFSFS